MNFAGRPEYVDLPEAEDVLTGEKTGGRAQLPLYGVRILRR